MGFPERTPLLIRAGIVLVDADNGTAIRVITLQYNPDTLTRSLQIKGAGGESGEFSEAIRLKGPPVETIKLEAEIDATDQLAAGDTATEQSGIHAALALLETLVYPDSAHLLSNNRDARSGTLEIAPMQSPLVLFVWSKLRVVPVRLTEFSITEESFDTALNPMRAKVSLGMRVLTVDDTGFDGKSGSLFMSYLRQKEQLAAGVATVSFGRTAITGVP